MESVSLHVLSCSGEQRLRLLIRSTATKNRRSPLPVNVSCPQSTATVKTWRLALQPLSAFWDATSNEIMLLVLTERLLLPVAHASAHNAHSTALAFPPVAALLPVMQGEPGAL
jgi:hypothetical protein